MCGCSEEKIEIFSPFSGQEEQVMSTCIPTKDSCNPRPAFALLADQCSGGEACASSGCRSPTGGSSANGIQNKPRRRGFHTRGGKKGKSAAQPLQPTAELQVVADEEWTLIGGPKERRPTGFKPVIKKTVRKNTHSGAWNISDAFFEIPVTTIGSRIALDSDGERRYVPEVKTIMILPWREIEGSTDGIVAVPVRMHGELHISWYWVCPKWAQWCLDRGVYLLMEASQIKCTHVHMGTHHVGESTAPLCHKLDATHGSCGGNCPGIHIAFPFGMKRVVQEQFDGEYLDMLDAYVQHQHREQAAMEKVRIDHPSISEGQLRIAAQQMMAAKMRTPYSRLTNVATSSTEFKVLLEKVISDPSEFPKEVRLLEGPHTANQDMWSLIKAITADGRAGLGDNNPTVKWVYCMRTNCGCAHHHPHDSIAPPTRKNRSAIAILIRNGRFPIFQLVEELLQLYIENTELIKQMRIVCERGGIEISETDLLEKYRESLHLDIRTLTKHLPGVDDEELAKIQELPAFQQNVYLQKYHSTCSLIREHSVYELPKDKIKLAKMKRNMIRGAIHGRVDAAKKARADGENLSDYEISWLSSENYRKMTVTLRTNPKDLDYRDVLKILSLYRIIATVSRAGRYREHKFGCISLGPENEFLDNIAYNICFFLKGRHVCPKSKYEAIARVAGFTEWQKDEFCAGGENCTHGCHFDMPVGDFSRLFGNPFDDPPIESTGSLLNKMLPNYENACKLYEEAKVEMHEEFTKQESDGYMVTKASKTEWGRKLHYLKRNIERCMGDIKLAGAEEIASTCVDNLYITYPHEDNGRFYFTTGTDLVLVKRAKIEREKAEREAREKALADALAKQEADRLAFYNSPEQVALRAEKEAAVEAKGKAFRIAREQEEADARAKMEAERRAENVMFSGEIAETIIGETSKQRKKRIKAERKAAEESANDDGTIAEPETFTYTTQRRKGKKQRKKAKRVAEPQEVVCDGFDAMAALDALDASNRPPEISITTKTEERTDRETSATRTITVVFVNLKFFDEGRVDTWNQLRKECAIKCKKILRTAGKTPVWDITFPHNTRKSTPTMEFFEKASSKSLLPRDTIFKKEGKESHLSILTQIENIVVAHHKTLEKPVVSAAVNNPGESDDDEGGLFALMANPSGDVDTFDDVWSSDEEVVTKTQYDEMSVF
jgi:hypothetical protein